MELRLVLWTRTYCRECEHQVAPEPMCTATHPTYCIGYPFAVVLTLLTGLPISDRVTSAYSYGSNTP